MNEKEEEKTVDELNDENVEDAVIEEVNENDEISRDSNDDYNPNTNDDFKEKLIGLFKIVAIALIIILILGFIISLFTRGRYDYAKVEDIMVEAAENYFKDNKSKLPKDTDEIVEIDATVLATNKYMKDLSHYIKKETCTGKVSVEKIDSSNYNYTPTLTCGTYSTSKLADKVRRIDNIKTEGFGVYHINGEYVYRGTKVNNYVKFKDSDYMWRIVKVTSNNETVLISEDRTHNNFVWDERYNNISEDNLGINQYKNSNIESEVSKLYNNKIVDENVEGFDYDTTEDIILTDKEKKKVVSFNACVGPRSLADTSRDGSVECSVTVRTKMAMLSTYDYLNASLDNNCKSVSTPDCQNYNYLVSGDNYWFVNGNSEQTSKVYAVTGDGYILNKDANNISYIRPVIHLNENVMVEKGKGTKEEPYVIR